MLKDYVLLILEPIWGFAPNHLIFIKNSIRTLKITGRDEARIILCIFDSFRSLTAFVLLTQQPKKQI